MESSPSRSPYADTSASSSRDERTVWVLLGLALVVVAVWFVHALGYWEDDSWIHLEFARSVSRGQGFVFNGQLVYGDTSPLWVWLLVAFHAVIPGWIVAGKALTVAGALFALTSYFALAASLTRESLGKAGSHLFAASMVLLLVVNPYFGYWAFSGMEALTAVGLVSLGVMVANRRPLTPGWLLAGAAIAGAAPLLRPEMGFFSVLLALLLALRLWGMPGSVAGRLGLLAGGGALVMLPFGLWARYAVHTFGSVLPTTNAAKRGDPHASVAKHLLQVYGLGFPLVLLGLVLLAAWSVTAWRSRREDRPATPWSTLPAGTWLVLLWSGINAVFYMANHTYVQTRYIFVSAPVLMLALLAAARIWWPQTFRWLYGFGVVAGVAVGLIATWPSVTSRVRMNRTYAELAAEIRTLPPDAPVAIYSIGEVSFLSEHPIIDTGGIMRPGIIPYLWDEGEERRTPWMYSQGAKYAVMGPKPVEGAVVVWSRDVTLAGWSLNPSTNHTHDVVQLWKLPPRRLAPSCSVAVVCR